MLRILIADDHGIVRKGLRQILEEEFSFLHIEEVASGDELLLCINESAWDIVLTDLVMPGLSGLKVLEEIKKIRPALPVLILSMYPEDQYALRVIKAGAAGYLTKDMAQEELVNAIRIVLSGKKYFTLFQADKFLKEKQKNEIRNFPHEMLSTRELEVMLFLARGKSLTEIAGYLSLAVTTISTYRSRILEKMNMKTNSDLTRYTLEQGLI